jgi:hypothetical protein
MALKPEHVIAYAKEAQRLELSAKRAPEVAAELEQLAAGVFAAGAPQAGDDPADFLATLLELRAPDA